MAEVDNSNLNKEKMEQEIIVGNGKDQNLDLGDVQGQPRNSLMGRKESERARERFENYCFAMIEIIDNDASQLLLTETEVSTIMSQCSLSFRWMDNNPSADKKDLEDQRRGMEAVCLPIVARLYTSYEEMSCYLNMHFLMHEEDFGMGSFKEE